ncbi:MAG: NlpC/P60 family protein [Luteolibacter sp.]
MWKRLLIICTVGAFLGIFLSVLNPVNSKLLKLAFLGCVFAGWVGLTVLLWRRKGTRIVCLVLPLLVAIPLVLPGGEIDSDELREGYVKRLSGFEGTKYHWGGESSRGIDCSGLPRRALRDALLVYGVRHFNGRAFRGYVEQWWFDASARALGEGYRDYTVSLGKDGRIGEMDFEGLLPGDLAVTKNGVHTLAYVGEGRWIQADPGSGSVVTLDGKKDENTWFHAPISMHRWKLFDQVD